MPGLPPALRCSRSAARTPRGRVVLFVRLITWRAVWWSRVKGLTQTAGTNMRTPPTRAALRPVSGLHVVVAAQWMLTLPTHKVCLGNGIRLSTAGGRRARCFPMRAAEPPQLRKGRSPVCWSLYTLNLNLHNRLACAVRMVSPPPSHVSTGRGEASCGIRARSELSVRNSAFSVGEIAGAIPLVCCDARVAPGTRTAPRGTPAGISTRATPERCTSQIPR